MPGLRSKIKFRGDVDVWGFDLKDRVTTINRYYELLKKDSLDRVAIYHAKGRNLIVNLGLDQIMNLMMMKTAVGFGYCGVDSSGAGYLSTSVTLNSQIGNRNPVSNSYLESPGKAHFDTLFANTDANGTWLGAGLFSSSVGSNLMCAKSGINYPKALTNTGVIAYLITGTSS